jgi:hypothetical protein
MFTRPKAMKKRGFVEIQANWAFAIIAGVMLILLFSGIVKKQIDRSSYEESLRTASFLSQAATGGEARIEFDIPGKNVLELDCETNGLAVNGVSAAWPAGIVAFGPKRIDAGRFTALRIDEKMPFLYARAFVIIPEDMRIKLSYDNAAGKTAAAIINAFGSRAEEDNSGAAERTGLLRATITKDGLPERAIDLAGGIFFIAYNNGSTSIEGYAPYINDGLLIAAIVSGLEGYECGTNMLMHRAGPVAASYIQKAQFLESDDCAYPINDLEIIRGNSSNAGLGSIIDAASRIEAQNNVLAESSCEVLY